MNDAPAPSDLVHEVEAKARALYDEVLDPIGSRFEFEPSPPPAETKGLPMVLLLGNHSSGKSTFINWLIGEDLQRTGIAPIDDGFTVITYGPEDAVKDGMSIVTDPTMSWGDLKRFGEKLLSYFKLRLRPLDSLKGIALIDSPGMIDAADGKVTRPYDFNAVVRWFAERADVILLLFDPDKPGTTGETLSVLTQSLSGLEHKLLIIFNKVDRFETMRDYARTYGALCWNLSKAIPRKDLPHIFNTYIPLPDAPAHRTGVPLPDFDKQREEVRHEVRRAPFRRVDNIISRLYQHARRMRMHVTVLDALARERLWSKVRFGAAAVGVLVIGALLAWGAWSLAPAESHGKLAAMLFGTAVVLVAAIAGLYAWDASTKKKNLSLDAVFERAYARQLTLGDQVEDLRALWASVRERTRRALDARGGDAPLARRAEQKKLERVIEKEVPELRALANRSASKLPAAVRG
jgi:hypothetical protein